MTEQLKKRNSVAIIGCENVRSGSAYSMLAGGAVEELILIGKDADELLEEINNLQRFIPLDSKVIVRKGDYGDAAEAKIVVISAAVSENPLESEFEILNKNIALIRGICGKLKRAGFDGVILVTTNPVDILAQTAHEASGLPANKVIGSGLVFDTDFLRAMLKGEVSFPSKQSRRKKTIEPATWCAALRAATPTIDFCQPTCPDFAEILEVDKKSRLNKKRQKVCAPLEAGTCVNRICEAVLRDERMILPVAAMTSGQHGISGVYLNLPAIVGGGGVEKVVELSLSDYEKRCLEEKSDILRKMFLSLKEMRKPAYK